MFTVGYVKIKNLLVNFIMRLWTWKAVPHRNLSPWRVWDKQGCNDNQANTELWSQLPRVLMAEISEPVTIQIFL